MRFIACLLITLLSASASSLALADWVDYSSNVELKHSTPKFNRATRQYDVVVSITNTSEQVIAGNQRLLVSRPSLPLLSEDGQTESGTPFVSLAPEQLAPSQTIQVSLSFALRRARLTFSSSFEVEPAASLEFTSDSSVEVAENASGQVYRPSAEGQDVSFALAAEFDSDAFNYVSETNALSFAALPDFESPADSDKDNVYTVKFIATDGQGNKAEQVVTVTVTDESQLEGVISFPTDGGDFGGEVAETLVTGYLIDHEDGQVLTSDVSELKVNGLAASIATDSPSTWQALIPVNLEAPTDIVLSFKDRIGNLQTNAIEIQNNVLSRFTTPVEIELSPVDNQALILDFSGKALFSLGLETGNLGIVSGKQVGSGINFVSPQSISLTDQGAVISDSGLDALVALNLTTGAREVKSFSDLNSGPRLRSPSEVLFDPTDSSTYVADGFLRAILKIDSDGNSTTIAGRDSFVDPVSGRTRFTGMIGDIDVGRIQAMALDSENNRLLISNFNTGQLIYVDIQSGNSEVLWEPSLSLDSPSDEIQLIRPRSFAFDKLNNRIILLDAELNALLALDLATGAPAILFDGDRESGITFEGASDFVWDQANNQVLVTDAVLDNVIIVDLETGRARLAITQDTAGARDLFENPRDAILDKPNNRLLVLQGTNGSVVSIRLDNGAIQVLSGAGIGTGAPLNSPESMVYDADNNRLIVLDAMEDSLVAINLATGNRMLLAENIEDRSLPNLSRGLAVDFALNLAFVFSSSDRGLVLAINLITGERRVISSTEVGSGATIRSIRQVILDKAKPRLLTTSSGADYVIAIDPTTGERTLISARDIGSGPEITVAWGIALDALNNRVFVTDIERDALFTVDLTTGDRTIISDVNTGVGIDFSFPRDVEFDVENNIAYVTDSTLDAIIAVNLETGDRVLYAD